MVGIVLHPDAGSATPAGDLVETLHTLGMLTVPAGLNVCRLLPALNTSREDIDECLDILERGIQETF